MLDPRIEEIRQRWKGVQDPDEPFDVLEDVAYLLDATTRQQEEIERLRADFGELIECVVEARPDAPSSPTIEWARAALAGPPQHQGASEDDVILDDPQAHETAGMKALRERGYKRINDPRKVEEESHE